jgi:hypothetical protein
MIVVLRVTTPICNGYIVSLVQISYSLYEGYELEVADEFRTASEHR